MTSPPFDSFFKTPNSPRDKYLSRLFGLFNEDVVRHWCALPETPYSDLGRPTLKLPGEARGYTLDFTLQHKGTGQVFVSEMKCWLEYEGYRYLRLPGQISCEVSRERRLRASCISLGLPRSIRSRSRENLCEWTVLS